jgi:hypothetical protein
MYADDLVLFGTVNSVEVAKFAQVMGDFERRLVLKINNAKSVVWFLNRVTNRLK